MKRFILILALVMFLATIAWAQSDAGFLERGPAEGFWACLHADGSFWAWTPLDDNWTYPDAVNWCAANGYSF